MRTNYVLIDYENVQSEDLSALKRDHFRVIVFVGAGQTRIPFETAAELQQMGSNAEYVSIPESSSDQPCPLGCICARQRRPPSDTSHGPPVRSTSTACKRPSTSNRNLTP